MPDSLIKPITASDVVRNALGFLRARLRRFALKAFTHVSPERAARVLARRYLTPSRCFIDDFNADEKTQVQIVTEGGQTLLRFAPSTDTLDTRILIVPGHDGHYRQFTRLIQHLRSTGATVDILVLPGHRDPSPTMCSLADIVDAVCDVGRAAGPYDALIAHCVGCNGSLFALDQGPVAEKLVFVSAPLALPNLIRFAGQQYGLSGRCLTRFIANVSALGAPYAIDTPWQPIAMQQSAPLLVVHARNDYAAPIGDVIGVSDIWPNAHIAPLDHGDHNSVLGQRQAIDQIAAFLRDPAIEDV